MRSPISICASIASGQTADDFIVKVYAWSVAFGHPDISEPYALATEEGFVEVDLPTSFQAFAVWPSQMEPNEVGNLEFWVRNDDAIPSHDNLANLALPGGWALTAGDDTQNLGSVVGGGGTSATASWTVQAPSSEVGAQTKRGGPSTGASGSMCPSTRRLQPPIRVSGRRRRSRSAAPRSR
ncbi:MAG: hypothetical protein JRG96_13895 [Deltaproteobacteria bacterium]|nr:hypothetical protein [Deltaproteobacteria bacterium]